MFYDFWIEELEQDFLLKMGFSGAGTTNKTKSAEIRTVETRIISPKNITELKKKKPKLDVFSIIFASDRDVIKFAIKNCLVDGICGEVRYPAIKDMAEKNIALVISFREFLESNNKSGFIKKMSRTTKLAQKYNVPIVIASGAKNKWELRGAEDLIAFGILLGLAPGNARKSLWEFQEKIFNRCSSVKSD